MQTLWKTKEDKKGARSKEYRMLQMWGGCRNLDAKTAKISNDIKMERIFYILLLLVIFLLLLVILSGICMILGFLVKLIYG